MSRRLIVCIVQLFLFFLITISTCSAAFQLPAGLEGERASTLIHAQVLDLLHESKFQELEDLAADLRKNKARFTSHRWQLTAFYQSFAMAKLGDAGWLELISMVECWRQAYPESVTATTALARAWFGYGWYARGTGYAKDVPARNMALFKERLNTAYEILVEDSFTDDCPGRYHLLLLISPLLGEKRSLFGQVFEQAIQFAPDYPEFYLTVATHLLPRWGGAPGAWLEFAEWVAQHSGSNNDLLYLMIVLNVQQIGGVRDFQSAGVSWPRLQNAFLKLEQLYPESPRNANHHALLACLANDRETLRQVVEDKNFRFLAEFWPRVSIHDCLAKNEIPPLHILSPGQMETHRNRLDGQVFKDFLAKAQSGDRLAMVMVSQMYRRGEGTPQDDLAAYAWLMVAGENQDLCKELYQRIPKHKRTDAALRIEQIKESLKK